MTDKMGDGLDDLYERLYRKRSGWHWVENPETGALALFPETAKDVSAWEARSLAMHAAQETIRLEAKPEGNTLAARKGQLFRGD